jgi:hypothetical protein
MSEERDSMLIYRSFYEAIRELPKENQAEVWEAVFELGFNFNEIELKGLSKTIFTLIKPNIIANYNRYKNGSKPKQKTNKTEAKQKQNGSKKQANKDKDVDKDIDNNEEKDDVLTLALKSTDRILKTDHRGKTVEWYERQLQDATAVSTAELRKLQDELGNRYTNRLGSYKSLVELMVDGDALACPKGMHDTVLVLKDQLTFAQYSKLADDAKSPMPIIEIVTEMHNSYVKNVKGKTTVYGTAKNWLKRRIDNPSQNTGSHDPIKKGLSNPTQVHQ